MPEPPAPPAPRPTGGGLTRQLGPFKAWQWGALAAGAGAVIWYVKSRSSSSTAATAASGIDPATGVPYSQESGDNGPGPGASALFPILEQQGAASTQQAGEIAKLQDQNYKQGVRLANDDSALKKLQTQVYNILHTPGRPAPKKAAAPKVATTKGTPQPSAYRRRTEGHDRKENLMRESIMSPSNAPAIVEQLRPEQIAHRSTWSAVPDDQVAMAAAHIVHVYPANASTITTVNPLDPGTVADGRGPCYLEPPGSYGHLARAR